jgi:8-oxoguanine deaminase
MGSACRSRRNHGWFATGIERPGIFAVDEIIQQVDPTAELPQTADSVLDLSGQIVLPGLVNTHHHLNQTLFRNLPAAQNNNLFP